VQHRYGSLQNVGCYMSNLKLYLNEMWSILWHCIIYTALYSGLNDFWGSKRVVNYFELRVK